jgi:diamine N-acetyltransferase
VGVEYLIEGERAALGPLRRELAETYAAWVNRLEVGHGILNLGIYDRQGEEAWLDEIGRENARPEPTAASFTIYDRRDGEAIGTSSLVGISHRHARATLGILLGERRGEGLGTEAARLTLDWAFHVLSLRNVFLTVLPWNAAAIRAYENAGFRVIGRRRDALRAHGRRWDEVYMDAVPGEFTGSVLAGRVPTGE